MFLIGWKTFLGSKKTIAYIILEEWAALWGARVSESACTCSTSLVPIPRPFFATREKLVW